MILTALNDYYHRLVAEEQVPEVQVPRFGFSTEKISFALLLNADGELVDKPVDIRVTSGTNPFPKPLVVPSSSKRSGTTVDAFFLWDKTAYVLGVSAVSSSRVAAMHSSFKALHEQWLADADDPGLRAVLLFLRNWSPDRFAQFSSAVQESLLDANVVFRLDGAREYVHDAPAAQQLRARMLTEGDSVTGRCLVTGATAPLARLHPAIKGVNGSQSSGASIVSFNLKSFTSYGKSQGENAPVSELAAFAYTTVLNHLLRRGAHNRQRLQIGDTTVVFWAEAATRAQTEAAEFTFAELLDPPVDDASETARLRSVLDAVAQGRPLRELGLELDDDTRLFVLGLAPNASRLSIRFWHTDRLREMARKLAAHYQDLELEPLPWNRPPAIKYLAKVTATYRKKGGRGGEYDADSISPSLAGELTRSILTGSRYPRSLLTNLIMRMRADGEISGVRVALCKAVLSRDLRLDVAGINLELPVSLDKTNTDPGYLLGRLFAELESVQRNALGIDINATIRDRYYGAASATPAIVFPMLLRNAQHHLSRLRKDNRGLAITLESNIGQIVDGLGNAFPRSLRLEAQGHFAIGYYHQAQDRFRTKDSVDATTVETIE